MSKCGITEQESQDSESPGKRATHFLPVDGVMSKCKLICWTNPLLHYGRFSKEVEPTQFPVSWKTGN